MLFSAAARDPKIAATFDKFATRQVGPVKTLSKTIPRSMLVNARHALRRGGERRDAALAEAAQDDVVLGDLERHALGDAPIARSRARSSKGTMRPQPRQIAWW